MKDDNEVTEAEEEEGKVANDIKTRGERKKEREKRRDFFFRRA
jgi:hypothetical protein